ncbi:MAG TPA: efflux RND transporter periplasmic adaptor subunit [Gemmatimonadaceae bacterium]|nr:efflux RND transporter periplasmic adaptor subunit [Gemmatimonadaceae bacterium]
MTRWRARCVVVSLGVAACGGGHDPGTTTRTPVVELGAENVAVVRVDTLRAGPVISGTLTPVRVAQLRAQLAGSVLQTFAEQGQHVSANQLLVRIDATAIRDAYRSAQSGVAAAQLAATVAEAQRRRYDTLFAAGAISDHDRELIAEQAAQAETQRTNAVAQLAQVAQQLASADVRSPFKGVVSARDVNVGDVIQPGMPLYSVVDPTVMQLEASVPADRIAAVTVGASVTFTLGGYGTRTFDGRITRINPVADPTTRQVEVFAGLPNPGGTLIGGLFATGRIVTTTARGLTVPASAIDARALRPGVLRVRNGKVERVDVAVGLRDDLAERVEITSGVAVGDTLLLGQAQALSPGTAVRVMPATDVHL